MESPINRGRLPRRFLWFGILPLLLIGLIPAEAEAQYFGRNKVQYDNFDFKIVPTTHFNIHFYPEEADAVEDAARMGAVLGALFTTTIDTFSGPADPADAWRMAGIEFPR